MAVEKLTQEQIEESLKQLLPGWRIEEEKLHRSLKFKSFVQAWGFMTQVAMLAEKADHHPEWSNVYSQVTINLTTHEADGISQRDFDLARQIDKILTRMVYA